MDFHLLIVLDLIVLDAEPLLVVVALHLAVAELVSMVDMVGIAALVSMVDMTDMVVDLSVVDLLVVDLLVVLLVVAIVVALLQPHHPHLLVVEYLDQMDLLLVLQVVHIGIPC